MRRAHQRTVASTLLGLPGLLGLLVACRDAPRARAGAPADLHVAVRTGVITAPDTARPGWTRVRVEESEDAHIVVVFRLPATTRPDAVTAFIATLDTALATPRPGVAMGGPEVGTRGDVIVHFVPGVYVLACIRRGENGHRHAVTGEHSVLLVPSAVPADSALASAPVGSQTVRMGDFAFTGSEAWTAGAQLLQIVNIGEQDHQLRLARLRDGATLQSWMSADDPGTVATTITGIARMSAGETAYLPVDLEPGTYVAYCLVTDTGTKHSHAEMGMVREIHVR